MRNFIKENKTFQEFKIFISKGNVIDLAVGVIIGSAFGKIVTSIVNDIFMPIIGIIIGGHDFTNLTIKFKDTTINYGVFIQNVVDFFSVSICIFIFVKIISKFEKKKEIKNEIQKDEKTLLLEEIRDLLKNEKNK